MAKTKMTVSEFLRTPNVYPLAEGKPYLPVVMRTIPPDIELTDLDEWLGQSGSEQGMRDSKVRYQIRCAHCNECLTIKRVFMDDANATVVFHVSACPCIKV